MSSKHGLMRSVRTLLALGAVLCAGVLVSGCNTNCKSLAVSLCQTCGGDMEDRYGDTYCICVNDGILYEGDFTSDEAEGMGIENDDDAQQWCDRISLDLTNRGSDSDAYCKGTLGYLTEWGSVVCEEVAVGP